MNGLLCFVVSISLLLSTAPALATSSAGQVVKIGSKNFTENIILGEIAAQLVSAGGHSAQHEANLGGSRILWTALNNGEISAYPEYTGTLFREILSEHDIDGHSALKRHLAELGIGMTERLGFNNTYVIGMLESSARALGISRISDLRAHPGLEFAFSNEFMDRDDGWNGLRLHYQLPQTRVRGLDHDLAYRGLESGSIDAMDLYSTDAEIQYYNIRSLVDDRHYFPDYHAVFLYRLEDARVLERHLQMLAGRIDDTAMQKMNAAVKLDGEPGSKVAADFNSRTFSISTRTIVAQSILDRLLVNTREHLVLVFISLGAAICFAVPLGILAARHRTAGQVILAVSGILQTIPSLALFVFMIPLLGIGGPPTIVALFIYSLLPIVRNTYSGLHDIPQALRESAQVIGLPATAILCKVELPLATRSILAGIKTSAVINIGTATLGALIGAGGYGQPILTGIRLDDTGLILEGAIPAAALALLVQGLFEFIERVLLPAPLRYRAQLR